MAEGQYSGSRGKYVYTSDDGREYVLTLDDTLVMTNSGLTVYDPATNTTAQNKPLRFKPRVVFWQGAIGTGAAAKFVRKALIAGTTASGLFSAKAPQAITIDGASGTTTGRRGEKMTFT